MTVEGTLVGTGITTVDGTSGTNVCGTMTIVGCPGTVTMFVDAIVDGK